MMETEAKMWTNFCFVLQKYIIPAALYSLMQSVLLIWHKNNEDLNKGDDINLNTIKLEHKTYVSLCIIFWYHRWNLKCHAWIL